MCSTNTKQHTRAQMSEHILHAWSAVQCLQNNKHACIGIRQTHCRSGNDRTNSAEAITTYTDSLDTWWRNQERFNHTLLALLFFLLLLLIIISVTLRSERNPWRSASRDDLGKLNNKRPPKRRTTLPLRWRRPHAAVLAERPTVQSERTAGASGAVASSSTTR